MADKVLTGTPQIAFRHGTQSNLNTLRTNKTATAGTFYLTNDTHRLYVGVGDGDAVPVNEGITLMTSSEFANINNSNNNKQNSFIISDELIILINKRGIHKDYPSQIKLVECYNFETDEKILFFTNNLKLDENSKSFM